MLVLELVVFQLYILDSPSKVGGAIIRGSAVPAANPVCALCGREK